MFTHLLMMETVQAWLISTNYMFYMYITATGLYQMSYNNIGPSHIYWQQPLSADMKHHFCGGNNAEKDAWGNL